MNQALPFLTPRTAAVPVEFFTALRRTIPTSAAGLDGVRDAGFLSGQALFDVFAAWLANNGWHAADELSDERFSSFSSAFFADHGWGSYTVTSLGDAVVAVDSVDWIEADSEDGAGCQLSTGALAGFFGRIADAPMAVMEVECRSTGHARCRFLLGSVDVLAYVHEAIGRGIPYDRAAASA